MTSPLVRLKPDTTLKEALRNGDPIAREGGLGEAEAAELRRAIAQAASCARARPLMVNAALAMIPLAIVLVLGSTLQEALMHSVQDHSAPPASIASGATAARQLYFQTAGGTRVIWIFTSDEEEK
jgi:hypothetical protein